MWLWAEQSPKGPQQTVISKALQPPAKWSYLRLFGRSVMVFLSVGWLVFYVNTSVTNASSVSSIPLAIYMLLSACVFIAICIGCWKHNHFTFPRQYGHWNRSFLCQRCGKVSQYEFPASSS